MLSSSFSESMQFPVELSTTFSTERVQTCTDKTTTFLQKPLVLPPPLQQEVMPGKHQQLSHC